MEYRVVASGVVGVGPDEFLAWELREHPDDVLMYGTDSRGSVSVFGVDRQALGSSPVRGLSQGRLRALSRWCYFAFGVISPSCSSVVMVSAAGEQTATIFAEAGEDTYYVAGPLTDRVDHLIITAGGETTTWPPSKRN